MLILPPVRELDRGCGTWDNKPRLPLQLCLRGHRGAADRLCCPVDSLFFKHSVPFTG
jgi:hypothetical protein